MRAPKRGASNPLLALSFTLGLVGLLCFTNPTLLSSSGLSHETAEEGGPSRGEFARALLDPGNESGSDADGSLTDLHEQHQDSLVSGARRGGHAALAAAGQHAVAGRRAKTLVLYVYNALDIEHQKNFDFFLRWGVHEGLTYKFIITEGAGVLDLLTLPPLPSNAEYIKTRACTTTWGAIGAVLGQLPSAKFEYFMVLDSSVKGPFIPTYAQQVLHWTEVFTGKLGSKVKMVGSMISCEGSPKDGNAAGTWRENPYVLPYVWATDKVGWELLAKEEAVFKCYSNPWDTRYFSDSGASLAVLKAGYNLDTLLTRYQGVDWGKQENWGCNERVRPDGEMYYDGVSITPYETVFVPVSLGYVQNSWSFVKTAAKYEEWLTAKASGAPKVNDNAWVSDSMSIKAQQLVYMNARGPGCFDFRFYLQRNPDLANFASDPLELWEHFLLLGQFQGRLHRFSCPVQIGNSYRVAYVKARGHTCFDHNYYVTMAPDLKVLPSAHDLWLHYAGFGQFENRQNRYVCADTFRNLTRGFDEVPMLGTEEANTGGGGAQQDAAVAAEGAQQAQQDGAGQLEAAQQQAGGQEQATKKAEGAAGATAGLAAAAAEAAAAGAQQ